MATIEAKARPRRRRARTGASESTAIAWPCETPEDADLIHEFAEFLLNNGLEPAEAATLARRAVEIDPDEPVSQDLRRAARPAHRAGGGDRADWQAIDLDPDDDALRDLLVSYKNNAQRLGVAP